MGRAGEGENRLGGWVGGGTSRCLGWERRTRVSLSQREEGRRMRSRMAGTRRLPEHPQPTARMGGLGPSGVPTPRAWACRVQECLSETSLYPI